jgi:rhodanese-related sulfurtransferase
MNGLKLVSVALLVLSINTTLYAGSKTSEALIAQAKKEVKAISPQALKKKIDNEDDVWMLDIREPYMIPEGSIEGMDNVEIPRGLLEFNLEAKIKDKNAFIVVYCRSGKGAALATKMIQDDLHYKNVVFLTGGLNDWLGAGYSIYSSFGEMKLVK